MDRPEDLALELWRRTLKCRPQRWTTIDSVINDSAFFVASSRALSFRGVRSFLSASNDDAIQSKPDDSSPAWAAWDLRQPSGTFASAAWRSCAGLQAAPARLRPPSVRPSVGGSVGRCGAGGSTIPRLARQAVLLANMKTSRRNTPHCTPLAAAAS